jgi:hypothetical protein
MHKSLRRAGHKENLWVTQGKKLGMANPGV